MPEPVSPLFGSGFAHRNPDLVASVMQSAASDWAASRLASAIEQVAVALVPEEQSAPPNGHLVRPQALVRP